MRAIALAMTALATVGLTACQEGAAGRRDRAGGGEGLCRPFAAQVPAAEGAQVVEDCLHRWGYTLARSDDDAEAVAQAVLAACSAPLARWNQQALGAAATSGRTLEAPSLLTGEPTNPIAEHNNFAEGRALFYVVQARAGKCDPPRDGDRTVPQGAAQPAAATPNSPDR